MKIIISSISTILTVCGLMAAPAPQDPLPARQSTENAARMAAGETPIYRTTVTSRTAKAVNYQHRGGATKIDFRGTDLLPAARGEAKVESKKGYIEIEVEFDELQPATRQGSEYLTYVLWAVTPEGRTSNLGELLLNGTKAKVDVTTELQVFALVVTAEPYYAVTRPSDLIVMENVVRPDTKGKIEEIDAKYELLQRGQYQRLSNPLALKLDKKLPLELYEARNAVQIARAVGADRFASETFGKAEKSLSEAEAYQARNAGGKPVAMSAREAVQMAEDSRAIAVKRQEEQALVAERQGSIDRETRSESERVAAQAETARVAREAEAAGILARAQTERLTHEKDAQQAAALADAERLKHENEARLAAAQSETERTAAEANAAKLKAQAEIGRLQQDKDASGLAAQTEAERLKHENEARLAMAQSETERTAAEANAAKIKAQAEIGRLQQDKDASGLAAQTEAERLKHENEARLAMAQSETDRLRLESDAKMASAGAEAARLKRENDAQRSTAQADLDRAAKEKMELRAQLLKQFSIILQTRDTARGLIVNMSDVLFDTGKYTLRPLAREKLAKVAGIVAGHPGLRLDVEGYTDSVGGDDYNQRLSEQRGGAVRDYLTQEGMAATSVTAKGFGKDRPVASNDTASGRQQNRRVELVISGDIIGTEIGTPIAFR